MVGGQVLKDKVLTTISPYIIESHLVIAFDKKWLDVCNGIPQFTVIIDRKNRLHLIGPVVKKMGTRLDT